MQIEVNGRQESIADGMTLRAYLETKGMNPNVVACELNLAIVKRAKLGDTPLQDGDKLEIIQMIGGG